VLACEGDGQGWFESVVIGTDDDLLKLRWRDWPKLPVFARRRSQVALLPVPA
jgi:hypothetical protein